MSKLQSDFIPELDVVAIKYLHTVKVANARQINRDVYRFKNYRSVNRSLKKLVDRGLIQTVYHSSQYPRKLYSATKKGFGKYVRDGFERRVQILSDSIPHDIVLSDIRSRFIDTGSARNYVTENELRCWQDYSDSPLFFNYVQSGCDAVAELDFPTGAVYFAVEYEASLKRMSRYRDIFSRYYLSDAIPFVLYIAGTKSLMSRMINHDKRYFSDKEAKIFYLLLSDFMTSDRLELADRNGGILNLVLEKPNN